MLKLPFLKARKTPRVKPDNEQDDKLIQGPEDDVIDHHLSGELMSACESKDPKAFRQALEALVLNAFEDEENGAR